MDINNPLNFGETIKWFSILKPKDKQSVASKVCGLETDDSLKEVAIPILEILRQYRNVIAHGQRFYSFKSNEDTAHLSLSFVNSLLEYDFIDKAKYKKGLEKRPVFINYFYYDLHQTNWNSKKFIEELNILYKEIEKYCKYNLFEVIGITQYDLEKLYVLNRLLKSL